MGLNHEVYKTLLAYLFIRLPLFILSLNIIHLLTLTRASVKFVHIAISSLMEISGYRFLAKNASSS